MSRTAKSLVGFGGYVSLTGAALVLAPGPTLDVLRTARTDEHWIRLLGMTAIVLGAYYIVAGRAELTVFARASLWGRIAIAAGFSTFVALGIAPVLLLGIAGNEMLGVLWTTLAMRADARNQTSR
jgi:hypothetical protein